MTVRKRKGPGRWRVDVVVWQGGERVRLKKSAKTKEEGVRIEAELRASHAKGEAIAPSKVPTFAEWSVAFLKSYAGVENKHSEQEAKKSIFRLHLVPAFGAMRLDRITSERVGLYKKEKTDAKYTPKTINNHLAALKKSLDVARRWKKVGGALPEITFLKVPPPPFTFLTFDDAAKLVSHTDAEWRALVLVAIRTGLRQGELLALKWEDVDLGTGVVHVRRNVYRGRLQESTKSNKTRDVPLSPEAVTALRPLPSRFVGGFVFGNGREMLTAGACKWPLYRAAKSAGIKRLGWHVLRHTFASHLAMRGVPMRTVQELLGHASGAMALRYAHLAPTVGQDAVALLDQPAPARAAR